MSTIEKQVQSFVHKYLEVSQEDEAVIVDYALKTWEPLPRSVKYLQFVGGAATGKTRASRVMEAICCNSFLPSMLASAKDIVVAMSGQYPCTLILDDFVPIHSKVTAAVLNQGAERGGYLTRMIKQEDSSVRATHYEVFGYKVICSYRKFDDPAIQSKCITVQLRMMQRRNIPIGLGHEFKRDSAAIRSSLIKYHSPVDVESK